MFYKKKIVTVKNFQKKSFSQKKLPTELKFEICYELKNMHGGHISWRRKNFGAVRTVVQESVTHRTVTQNPEIFCKLLVD